MGLALPALRFLTREHKRRPFTGKLLTLGRQCVYASFEDVERLLAHEQVSGYPLPMDVPRLTNIPSWQTGPQRRYTSDVAFFYALTGQRVLTLDVSEYEGAEYVWDLNAPVPQTWEGQFDTILDFGTLEHIFDVKQALWNINRLLKPDGRVIHMLPASNYMEHGFYSFSPTFFYDYYGANSFTNLRGYLAEQPAWRFDHGPWQLWRWDAQRPYIMATSPHSLVFFFCAQKAPSSTVEKIPQQGSYKHHLEGGGRTGPTRHQGWRATIYYYTPRWLLIMLKRLLRHDRTVKPWGLRYRGRF